ncbi:hypothetical protein HYD66_02860 [Mycoplasmopsis bovis]|nr:hypothetical protein [Mycoplasmopsis bovis]QQH55122.1 hypothetical protein HYD66_02860 [Mycoplasmopsis bovis]
MLATDIISNEYYNQIYLLIDSNNIIDYSFRTNWKYTFHKLFSIAINNISIALK